MWEIDGEIFFILIFGFGLIIFFCILSQYIFNLDKPWPYAPTNSAFIIAFELISASLEERLFFINISLTIFFIFFIFTILLIIIF